MDAELALDACRMFRKDRERDVEQMGGGVLLYIRNNIIIIIIIIKNSLISLYQNRLITETRSVRQFGCMPTERRAWESAPVFAIGVRLQVTREMRHCWVQ